MSSVGHKIDGKKWTWYSLGIEAKSKEHIVDSELWAMCCPSAISGKTLNIELVSSFIRLQ